MLATLAVTELIVAVSYTYNMEDIAAKFWVFVPIFAIAAMAGVVRYYVHMMTSSDNKPTLQQIQNGHIILRAELLKEHGKFIPRRAFLMRKHSFLKENDGYLRTMDDVNPLNLVDPMQAIADLKRNYVEAMPLVLIGGFVRWKFPGIVTIKLPFPLFSRFKELLQVQQGPDFQHANSSWLSSSSWYVLCLSGLQPVLRLFLKKENPDENYSVPILSLYDTFNTFRQEREALELCKHEDVLGDVCQQLLMKN